MDYQTLTEVLGQSKAGTTPAPSLNSIIQGIQSQYQPIPSMPVQSGLYGANRYISGSPQFGAIDVIPEYGMAYQAAGPAFIPSAFDRNIYNNINTQGLSDLISQLDSGVRFDSYGGFGGDSGPTSTSTSSPSGVSSGIGASTGIGGFSIGPNGMASPNSVNQGMATALGMVVGLPLGLVASLNNAAANAAAAGFNAAISDTMGVNANNTSPAAVSANAAANGMSGTTGGAAAAAASAAAAAAAAAGHSDAAIGAASQAAADAAIGGASPSAAAAAAADAANAAAADAADAEGGGLSLSSSVGESGTTDSSTSTDGSGGGGGGGAKIICTKLHALGLMPTNIYEADQAFGKKLVSESPETYYGYVRWAQHIVDLMDRDDLLGKIAVFCSYHIATPWSLAMAEEMGQPVKSSWFGKFLMKRGLQFCKLVGSGNKQTAIA